MKEFDELKAIIAAAEDDVAKADGGTKAAKTRVRKAMMDVKKKAQEVRVALNSGGGGKGEAEGD